MSPKTDTVSVTSLIGNQVKNRQGESIGKIEELVIEPETEHIKSVVLSLGEAPDFGSALSSIPWAALKFLGFREFDDGNTNVGGKDASGRRDLENGNPKSSDQCSVYTFPVRRFR